MEHHRCAEDLRKGCCYFCAGKNGAGDPLLGVDGRGVLQNAHYSATNIVEAVHRQDRVTKRKGNGKRLVLAAMFLGSHPIVDKIVVVESSKQERHGNLRIIPKSLARLTLAVQVGNIRVVCLVQNLPSLLVVQGIDDGTGVFQSGEDDVLHLGLRDSLSEFVGGFNLVGHAHIRPKVGHQKGTIRTGKGGHHTGNIVGVGLDHCASFRHQSFGLVGVGVASDGTDGKFIREGEEGIDDGTSLEPGGSHHSNDLLFGHGSIKTRMIIIFVHLL
mmetsp:Transcript_9619/g.10994  ORF Transcript_9619/g.10994 Transcript_9619/m.10994 type:complete len:272 (+) Transcript_9619:424-1239(+)